MSKLRIAEEEIAEMERRPNIRAIRIGRTEPFHLAHARKYQGNAALNPHLPGKRPGGGRPENIEGGEK